MKKPTFRDLEASVKLDHVRPYYKVASVSIHAHASGVFSCLGLLPEEDILLGGPSGIGLSGPARLTAITLTQITTSVLTYGANIDCVVVCNAMAEFSRGVQSAFDHAEAELLSRNDV